MRVGGRIIMQCYSVLSLVGLVIVVLLRDSPVYVLRVLLLRKRGLKDLFKWLVSRLSWRNIYVGMSSRK